MNGNIEFISNYNQSAIGVAEARLERKLNTKRLTCYLKLVHL
jgi:hypothetical protein